MSDGIKEDQPPVEAVPDIIASPSEPKKMKVLSNPQVNTTQTPLSSKQDNKTDEPTDNDMESDMPSNPEAGPSTGITSQRKVDDDEDVSVNIQPPTPEAVSMSLPVVETKEEEWSHCHMTWRGKVYDFKVDANDMYVRPIPSLRFTGRGPSWQGGPRGSCGV